MTGLVTLWLVDLNQPGRYPTCPFLALTGCYCPGCGSLRAIRALLHGDVATAWARNPLAVLAAPYLLVGSLTWSRRTLTGRARGFLAPAPLIWALLGAILVFWVARNLPGMDVLSPA